MTTAFLYSLGAVFGLLFGSFANVAVLRAGDWKGVLAGRSRCPHCKKPLSGADMVPVLSYLVLRGRCRYCRKPISLQYPLVEMAGALLGVFSVWYAQGNVLESLFLFFGLLFFLVIAVEDVRDQEVTLAYCVLAGLFGGIGMVLGGVLPLSSVLIGVVTGAGIVLLITWLWKRLTYTDGMGSGDVWISGAVGAVAGFPLAVIAFGVAVMVGAVVGVALYGRQKNGLKSRLPFGPFLSLGLMVALVWGQTILSWYIL